MPPHTLLCSLIAGAIGIVLGMIWQNQNADPMTQLESCIREGTCTVVRYEYVPTMAKQAGSAPAVGCALFNLPTLQTFPDVSFITEKLMREPRRTEDLLVTYIGEVLQIDQANRLLLNESYSSYLETCSDKLKKPSPKSSSFDSSVSGVQASHP